MIRKKEVRKNWMELTKNEAQKFSKKIEDVRSKICEARKYQNEISIGSMKIKFDRRRNNNDFVKTFCHQLDSIDNMVEDVREKFDLRKSEAADVRMLAYANHYKTMTKKGHFLIEGIRSGNIDPFEISSAMTKAIATAEVAVKYPKYTWETKNGNRMEGYFKTKPQKNELKQEDLKENKKIDIDVSPSEIIDDGYEFI